MDRFDALEREAFENMVRSGAFQLFGERIRKALQVAGADCERADDELKLRRAQGQAAALRMVLALPEQILTEMKGPKK